MIYEDINVGDKLWSMRGSFPVKMEVIKTWKCKHLGGWWCYYVTMWDENKRSTHSRHPDQLFKTYNELRDFIFPEINNQ